MIRISQIKIPIKENTRDKIILECSRKLRINKSNIESYKINKRSIDARKKPDLFYVYELDLVVKDEEVILRRSKDIRKTPKENYKFEDNEKYFKWTINLKKYFTKNKKIKFNDKFTVQALYRPFCKQYLYMDKNLIHRASSSKFFANNNHNKIIICSGNGGNKDFSVLISDKITDLNCLDASDKVFPLYYYETEEEKSNSKYEIKDIAKDNKGYQLFDYKIKRKFAISDYIMKLANEKYGRVSEEDIFYYVYGILHSPKYRIKYSNDLKKMLPHIPLFESKELFFHFSDAGRKLASIHLNYENQKPLKELKISGLESDNFVVQKMRFGKVNSNKDKTIINYNNNITISNIPEKAYDYVVNGKSAIEWIMERYQYTIDKDTEIINNPNEWRQVEENKRYILDLLLSVITVSVKTMEIVDNFLEHDF
ncbi:type ISP restriction/modification enzyme [uncultured Brachyspira sp.]|uniref:type ISP restriction/modification enzyme n=1 Tax=uncultured Brachyspira sp. TaxID=221953 RepID=UPI003211BF4B